MPEYVLALSEEEVARYRFMAEVAQRAEADRWTASGIIPGAIVADVGCGPAAMSVTIAGVVGPTGRVIGVERDPVALEQAAQVVAAANVGNVELRAGEATATGVEPASVDVAMMRHVLAHNGGSEQAIVDHLATLVRPGGSVYLVDVDLTGFRMYPPEADLEDLSDSYAEFHRRLGNDPLVGLRLGRLLADAGLVEVVHTGSYVVTEGPVGLRPPSWVARDRMVAAGVIDDSTVARWRDAFTRIDGQSRRPTLFIPSFIATGRRQS